MPCILLWSSAVRVPDSHVYREMDVTRQCTCCILGLREILLSLQTGFNFVSAAVVCAVLESVSGLETSSDTTEPRNLKPVTVSSFCLFTCVSLLMLLVLFLVNLVFSTLISMPQAMEVLSRPHLISPVLLPLLSCYAINVITEADIGDCSAPNNISAVGVF